MQLLDKSLSRYSLQRWVAFITGTGALVVALINLVGYSLLYDQSPIQSLGNAFVLPIMVLSLLFYLSGAADSKLLRFAQVLVFSIAGLYLALVASGEYMSSAVFVIYAFVLYYEFRTEALARTWLIVLGVGYAMAIVYSIVRSAQAAAADAAVSASVVGLAFTNIAVFAGSVVFLFALVIHRQHLMRQRYAEELEQRVAERTAELQEAVIQRDTMLQEIHHRVGNSLQLLASFVSLQQEDVEGAQRQVLMETELRVHAIADVHATLYSQHQLSHLPLREYVHDLIADMQIAYRSETELVAAVTTEVEAHIDFAISFGIILNELITNSAKHGGGGDCPSTIEVALYDSPTDLRLTVKDRGAGFPADFVPGIGTEVVNQLVQQNDGFIERTSDGGAIVSLSFPMLSVVKEEPMRAHIETA